MISNRHTEGVLLARFNKTTVLLLLLAIVLFSLALRYPLVEHERHNDTFFNMLLADSILKNDYAVWTFHPLSYLGYYPISYPSGTPFLLAEMSEITGVGLSPSILLLGMFSGVLFALSVFCLTRTLLRRVDLCLLAMAFSVFAPRFVDTSYWSGSARAPFVALALFAIFVAFKTGSSGRPILMVIMGIAVIGCFSLHHMAVVFILFCLAYVLSVMLARASISFASRGSLIRTRRWFAGFVVAILGVAITSVAVFYLSYYEPTLVYDYSSTSLFSFEPTYISILLNLAASYTHQIGIVLPIAVLGLPVYFLRTRLTTYSLFPVLLIISFVPLLPSAHYITMILSPFAAILAVAWFGIALKRNKGRRLVMAVLVVVLSMSLVLPVWSSQRWNEVTETSGDSVVSDNLLFTDATYLRSFRDDAYAISNNDILSSRLAGASGVVFLRSGVVSALTGDVTAESLKVNLSWMNQRFPQNLYLWFEYEDDNDVSWYVIRYFVQGNQFPAGSGDVWKPGEDYYETHSRMLVVVDNRWPSNYVWVWAVLPANLPSELKNAQWAAGPTKFPLQSYSIYISERITLYATEVPNRYG